MRFTSISFYIFAAITIILYFLLPKRTQWLVLLTASIVFYITYGWEKVFFILLAAWIAWTAGKRMDSIYQIERNPTVAKRRCKPILLFAVSGLVALLIYAKIGTWVIQSVSSLLSWERGNTMQAIMALGVSYYTFSLISYLADIYWRKDKAEHSFLRLLLFTIYFPKILQGPISRHKNLGPQLRDEHKFDYKEFCYGLQLMLWGYFKKLVIADRLAVLVNEVFREPGDKSGSVLLVAICFSCIQIYCDFSGCMDIVGGFSQILGLKLAANFNHPFFSRSAAEFWRRWHITLGTWFKDYVYMPLLLSPKLTAVSKKVRDRFGIRAGKAVMTAVPLLAVWLLTGLWHNASKSYVVWGLYWGGMIILSTLLDPELKKLTKRLRINTETGSWRIFQMVRTFLLFVVSRIITIPGSLRTSWSILKSIVLNFHPENLVDGSLYTLGLDRPNFILAVVCIGILWMVSHVQEKGVRVRDRIAGCNIVFRWMIYYIGFFSILIFGIYGLGYDAASFIYMKF